MGDLRMKSLSLFGRARFSLSLAILLGMPVHADEDTHQALNWSAPFRWVHVDNVDSSKAQIFESSRIDWLKVLRKGDDLLGDGRPLFWHARAGAVQTYVTFYPFSKFGELDERRAMVQKTNAAVGQGAVDQYDAGDVALVAPHYTQIWRRSTDDDFATPENNDLTELSATFGRMEICQIEPRQEVRADQLWKEIRQALAAEKYPVVCRVFFSSYGSGDMIFMWLARDAKSFLSAPLVEEALARRLGEHKSGALVAEWKKIVLSHKAYDMERRADLSNLGK